MGGGVKEQARELKAEKRKRYPVDKKVMENQGKRTAARAGYSKN